MVKKSKVKANGWALLPIGVFLFLYLGLGIYYEYIAGIEMGFYNIPIVVAFLVAIMVACIQNRKVNFNQKLQLMAVGVGDANIIVMILIFLVAGIFVGVTGRSSAQSVAYFMLSISPAWLAVVVLFFVACFVSTAMGTSCGTITLILPIAVAVSETSGYSMPLCVGTVMGGAMFGDNLSFISDTTIVACSTQGCEMKDKFRANVKIALPAAVITLMITLLFSLNGDYRNMQIPDYDIISLIPYLIVLVCGIIGLNVFLVLIIGIVCGAVISVGTGTVTGFDLIGNMGTGASSMFETIMVAVLVSALCGLVREYGGFEALLALIRKLFKGKTGSQFGMGLLVGIMDIATANNTIAIVMAGPIVREMSEEYEIEPKRCASILDTFSCIFQGIIPYGAQMLLALSTMAVYGYSYSAFQVMPYLFYPYCLAVVSIIYILIQKKNVE
jgi:Na+/H+ antiporter NhaC